jgi:AcrR family transcriptional regulator
MTARFVSYDEIAGQLDDAVNLILGAPVAWTASGPSEFDCQPPSANRSLPKASPPQHNPLADLSGRAAQDEACARPIEPASVRDSANHHVDSAPTIRAAQTLWSSCGDDRHRRWLTVRSHGWAGNTPASDEEAIERILDTADRIIGERGSAMRIADVARTLGVTRQTVYRYFPGTEALLVATAMRSADGFLGHLAAHVKGITDPVVAIIEGLALGIEELASDSQVKFVLQQRTRDGQTVSIMSDTALAFSRSMLHRYDVDWEQRGFDEAGLDELAEFCLRLMHSFLVDPGRPSRSGTDLRRYLTRWVGPAVAYPQLARAMDGLRASEPPRARRRPSAASWAYCQRGRHPHPE